MQSKYETSQKKYVCHRESGVVGDAKCDYPAGKSGYCNHLMALLFKLADYSLSQLKSVPEEVAITSKNR